MSKTSIVEVNGLEIIHKECPVPCGECPATIFAFEHAVNTRKIQGACVENNRSTDTERFKLGMDASAAELETLKNQMQSICRECKLIR